MADLLARTGRERQRYENGYRLVAGCIPYRLKNMVDDTVTVESGFEICLITSPNRHDLVFPKGGWEDDETMVAAASREALEEAGVKGKLDETELLGEWEFRSKTRESSFCPEGKCRSYMFALEVTEELMWWPEQSIHDRRWLSVAEAYERCRYGWMREVLDKWKERIQKEFVEHRVCKQQMNMAADALLVSEVAEHQIPRASCFMKPSATQCLENTINVLC